MRRGHIRSGVSKGLVHVKYKNELLLGCFLAYLLGNDKCVLRLFRAEEIVLYLNEPEYTVARKTNCMSRLLLGVAGEVISGKTCLVAERTAYLMNICNF